MVTDSQTEKRTAPRKTVLQHPILPWELLFGVARRGEEYPPAEGVRIVRSYFATDAIDLQPSVSQFDTMRALLQRAIAILAPAEETLEHYDPRCSVALIRRLLEAAAQRNLQPNERWKVLYFLIKQRELLAVYCSEGIPPHIEMQEVTVETKSVRQWVHVCNLAIHILAGTYCEFTIQLIRTRIIEKA